MPVQQTPRQRLDSLIDQLGPDIRSAYYASIQGVVNDAIITDMTVAITNGDVVAAFQALGFTPAAMRPIVAAIERAFETGGIAMGDTFPKYLNTSSGRAVFRFDVRNSRAEAWLRDHSSSLVQRLTDEARINVQNVLTEGMQAGRNPRNVALDIVGRIDKVSGNRTGGIIGLTNQQENWVRNTRANLHDLSPDYFKRALRDKRFDKTVQKAIEESERKIASVLYDEVKITPEILKIVRQRIKNDPSLITRFGKPLPSETIDKLVDRYKDNALKYRAETIARTEALQSLNRSEYEATMQAVDSGAVRKQDIERIWDSAGDNRVRYSHSEMDGQIVGFDDPFTSPSGDRLMFPGDTSLGAGADEIINCRCRVRTQIDWLADID